MTDKFQPDFYVTCATVIPVLFLAVAVQARGYETVLSERKPGESPRSSLQLRRSRYAVFVAYGSVVAGGVAEALALFALAIRGGSPELIGLILGATVWLLGVVVASSFLGYLRIAWQFTAPAPFGEAEAGKDQRAKPPQGTTEGNGGQPGAS